MQSEKTYAAQQLASGSVAFSPVGFVRGVVIGTDGAKLAAYKNPPIRKVQ